jgi:hypothetical protein
VASEGLTVEEWELKAHARARRARRLAAERNGMDLSTRIRPGASYQRGFKHVPRTLDDWDLLD